MGKKQQFDYGLALLRMIMCFMVVLCHYWDATDASGIFKLLADMRGYAVPVFMILTFIFCQNIILKHEKARVKDRFERLLIPQIGWAVIYWGIYLLVDRIIGTNMKLGISDLFWQMFTGHSPKLNATMWYQIDLIYLTALFLIVATIFKNRTKWVLCIITVVAYVIQYTGINMVFSSLRYELSYPLGRFSEMVPLAVAGYLLSSSNSLETIKKHRIISIISSLLTIIITFGCGKLFDPQGYGYQGIKEILMGVALIVLFYAIPFEKINESNKKVVTIITSYTMGIYCMHRLVGTLLNGVLSHLGITFIGINTFAECILIYLIAFVASLVGYKIFKNTKLKSMFN